MSTDPTSVIPTESEVADERAVLGAMMRSETALMDCAELLHSTDFAHIAHRTIFDGMVKMNDEGLPVDALTLRAWLDSHPGALKYGGAGYLHTCFEACVTVTSAAHYAAQLRDRAARRDLGNAAEEIRCIAGNPMLDTGERSEQASRAVDSATARDHSGNAQPVSDLLLGFLEDLESPEPEPAIRTGWEELERIIPGFRPGEFIVVGARPGMGKTAVMLEIARVAAVRDNTPVLFYSLEMSTKQIMQRLIAAEAYVPLARIRNRELDERDWQKIQAATDRLMDAPLFLPVDSFAATPRHIRAELKSMRRKGTPAGLLVVDYLQLMNLPGMDNRQAEVSEVSRALKLTALEYDLPVIAGSQLNRNAESRTDKRPNLSDLRESGAVEQDADAVILLYRDEVYNPESKDAGTIELHVAKHRNGPTGTATLAFRNAYAQVANEYLPSRMAS